MIPIFSKTRHTFRAVVLLIAAAGLAALAPRVATGQGLSGSAHQPLRTSTDLAKIDLTVLDRHGNFIGGLSQNQFRILDGGAEQPIVAFAPVEAPAQVLVMIETGPAVYLIHNEHLTAAYALLDGLAPDDEVALVTYDQAPRAILTFTPEKPALLAALEKVQYTIGMGNLNFYDSLSAVVDWLAPLPGKRAVVLLTTGLDSAPPARWDALVRKLRGTDVVVFSVALGRSLFEGPNGKSKPKKNAPKAMPDENGAFPDARGTGEWARADHALLALASMTGGRAYFPRSSREFVPIYHEIVSALRHQYVLGIAPARDGQFHALRVEVLDKAGPSEKHSPKKPEYRVLAREGYLAPEP